MCLDGAKVRKSSQMTGIGEKVFALFGINGTDWYPLDLCQESVVFTPLLTLNTCKLAGKSVYLHRVFHSIRFKVNKVWGFGGTPFLFV